MENIEHNKYGKVLTEASPTKQLMTCEHGITGKCWWCEQIKNKPVEKQIGVLDKRIATQII